ncbi:hypothetical protein Lnau_1329 [Legionella nautarum]|uniref:Uncharacterized protein n=1 Tax=Legionella nautarum TaxID=45070 RepID=A0A0W0WVK4_9GAMM|nr:hypothetical protein [Legionella nautarum]KTD36345.1 hypothetical protein Lnau_1329 [Legionella nautarum]
MIKFNDVLEKQTDFLGPIIIHLVEQNGYGDISLCIKITKFLHRKYPQASVSIIGDQNAFTKIKEIAPEFLNTKLHPNLEFYDKKELWKLPKNFFEEVKLEIETAIFDNSLNRNNSLTPHTKIFIGEYGNYESSPYKPPIISLSGNIGKNYPGILIEPDLQQFSRLDTIIKSIKKTNILSRMSDSLLQRQVCGKEISDRDQFIEKNGFAFAYYNLSISYKRAAVIFAASNAKEKANYFISASHQKYPYILDQLTDNSFKAVLKKLGYSSLFFYNESSENPYQNILLDESEGDGRKFKVFIRERFPQILTLDLMRLSDLCGVAGDQCLTESISLGIVPIPEELNRQVNIIDQIAKNFYSNTVMAEIYNLTWKRQRERDINYWIEAGQIIRERHKEAVAVLTKIQDQANLYHALDHRLNLEFNKDY